MLRRIMMKNEINIVQKNNDLTVELNFSEHYEVRCIVMENSYTNEEKRFSVRKSGEVFVFDINQNQILSELLNVRSGAANKDSQSEANLEETQDNKEGLWYWFAEVVVDIEKAPEALITKLSKLATEAQLQGSAKQSIVWTKEGSSYKRYIRIGKFKETNIEGLKEVMIDNHTVLTYINTHGYLSTRIDEEVSGKIKFQIEKMRTNKSVVTIEGRLNTRYFGVIGSKVILKSRSTPVEYVINAKLIRDDQVFHTKFGRNIYYFKVEIDFEHLLEYTEDIYDLFIDADMPYSQEPIRIRVGRPTFRAKYFFGELVAKSEEEILLVNPYYTIFKSNLSFEVFPFVEENYKYLKRTRRFARIHRLLNRTKDVWIVGERPYKAQDTGYHFFKYMREQHPEKNVYYVISKDSPEYRNVQPLGNILEFGSKEHIKNTIIATKIISSHHADYLFPLRTKSFNKIIRATRIFLQHGVFGVKNMAATYGKQALTFKTDMFITSSEYEREYAIRDLQYKQQDVFVTGLSRFDALFKQDTGVRRQVLIIPTWRDWLQNIDSFLESEYFERYTNLVKNKELLQHAKANNYELVLCLHPNMQMFSSYFEDSPVKVIYQGDIDVQKLIKESALMITDYSSVAFDFSFLHKPVIYYQFDQAKFIGRKGSHIDLENDLPGVTLEEEIDVVEKVKYYVNRNFKMDDVYKVKANRFIAYRDTESSRRIYEAVTSYKKRRGFVENLQESNFNKDLYNKFRRSKYYFPVMKVAYSIMKTVLPINKKKVFFESGLGKNFSDSPKEIFEVLQDEKRNFECVWSYNGKLKRNYKDTKVIKRLSPSYYYHLATSRYWVNNQNFPTYIKKRKGTDYLQTWHGTPLKRMLHDIEEIQGRDETYLSRVSEAVSRWDYLVSPSRYATDCFKSAFKYDGSVLEEGYPRNDIFYNENQEDIISELRDKLNIDHNKKIILYAPTFRDNQTSGKRFTMDIPLDFEAFHERFGDEYVLLIRMHVVISKRLRISEEYRESIMNVSAYPDIQELMLLSDILITDYSSVFFDYLNTDKPILYYTYDLEEYRDNLRGFYLNFEQEAPGPLCLEENQLYDAITNIDKVQVDYQGKYQEAKNRYCYLDDGQAAKRIVKKVFD